MHHTAALVLAPYNQFFAAGKQQLSRDRINTIVCGRDDHLLTHREPVGIDELLIRQSRWRGRARHCQSLLGTHLAGCAMTEAQHPRMPCIDCRISFDQRSRHRRGLEEPEAMSQGEVGNRRLAKQVVTLLALQLQLQTRHDRRPLVLRLFGRQFCRATTTEQTGAVGQKRLDRFLR
ncbi:hypothetical protein D9M71_109020 [compost metagenome]